MTAIGGILAAARSARGLTLEEAAATTRIRLRHLKALEGEGDLPAPVYARGYLRTYATFLELDADTLDAQYEGGLGKSARNLAFRPLAGLNAPSAVVLTAPIAAAIGALLLAIAFTGYVYRALDSVRVVPPTPGPAATALPSPSPASAPAAAPPVAVPAARQVSLLVTAMDTVWIDVQVDGKPQFADAGKVLEAGSSLTFNGLQKVRITSGKGAATQVAVNGRAPGPLGAGVVTREFTPQS